MNQLGMSIEKVNPSYTITLMCSEKGLSLTTVALYWNGDHVVYIGEAFFPPVKNKPRIENRAVVGMSTKQNLQVLDLLYIAERKSLFIDSYPNKNCYKLSVSHLLMNVRHPFIKKCYKKKKLYKKYITNFCETILFSEHILRDYIYIYLFS